MAKKKPTKKRGVPKRGNGKSARSLGDYIRTLKAVRRGIAKRKAARGTKANPAGKLKKVTKSTGWLRADAVRFVKKRGRMEVFIKRGKARRKKAK